MYEDMKLITFTSKAIFKLVFIKELSFLLFSRVWQTDHCVLTGLFGQRSRHGLHTMRPHILLFGMYKGSEDVSDL